MTDTENTAAEALASTSTEALLRAAYALTHRIGGAGFGVKAAALRADLRAQRDLIDAEIVRRTESEPPCTHPNGFETIELLDDSIVGECQTCAAQRVTTHASWQR